MQIQGNKIFVFVDEFNGRFLVPLKQEHLFRLMLWRNKQMRILRQNTKLKKSDQLPWFKRMQKDKKQSLFGIAEINNRGIPVFIGYCGLTNIDNIKKTGEVSFLVNLARAQRHKLYREDFLAVLHMLCKYGFSILGLNRIYAETFIFRRHHISILEDFGFKLGERLRKRKLFKGKYHDSLIHAIEKKSRNSMEGNKCFGAKKKF